MATYYRFKTPGDLAEFILACCREGINTAHVIDAGEDGIFVSQHTLQHAGGVGNPLATRPVMAIEERVTTKQELFSAHPDARRVRVDDCIRGIPLVQGARGTVREPARDLARTLETSHGALRAVRSGYREVVLAVKRRAGDGEDEALYLRALVAEVAQMEVVSFEYAAVEPFDSPEAPPRAAPLPFSYLLRIHHLQYRSFIYRCIHDQEMGVYDALVPWRGDSRFAYVSAGYDWRPAHKAIEEMMGQLGPETLLLSMAPGVNRKTAPPQGPGSPAAAGGQERHIVKVEGWIDGLKADRTLLSMPIETSVLGPQPQGMRNLEVSLRLERRRSHDHYAFRHKRLTAAIRRMQEEAEEAGIMAEFGDRTAMGAMTLYAYQEPAANPYSREMDSCLRSLLMTYPRDCLYSLLHVRAELPDALGADTGRTHRYDLVVDRALQTAESGINVWSSAGAAEERHAHPWPLPSEYHPGSGLVFDLENTLNKQYGLSVFLPRGHVLRPHVDFKKEHRDKVLDLLCRGEGGVDAQVRARPEAFIILLIPGTGGKIRLVTVPKDQFAPLGERFNYFNGTLEVREDVKLNPPAAAGTLTEAWGAGAVEAMYRDEVRVRVKEAAEQLTVLKSRHAEMMRLGKEFEKDCLRYTEEIKATREACEHEIRQWRQFSEQMRGWRGASLDAVMKRVEGLVTACEEAKNSLPVNADAEYRALVDRLLLEAESRSQTLQTLIGDIGTRMRALFGRRPPAADRPAPQNRGGAR